MKFRVKVIQGKKEKAIIASAGENLFDLLIKAGYYLDSPCGGKGTCGKCKVRVIPGSAGYARASEEPSAGEALFISPEERAKGFRLACRLKITDDLRVELPAIEEMAQIMTGGGKKVSLNPLVREELITVKRPDLEDQLGDVDRIEKAMDMPGSVNHQLMTAIPTVLRENDFELRVVLYDKEIISIRNRNSSKILYGLAIDLGTTTVAGYLVNLETGEEVGYYSALNPQRVYGADVISRVSYTMEYADGLNRLGAMIRNEINKMVDFFVTVHGIDVEDLYHLTVVGNTIMLHILAGLQVSGIAVAPFIPVVSRRFDLNPKELGVDMNPRGKITVLPTISGYVGADTIAAMLAAELGEKEELSLLIDIGTNGELAVGNKDRIFTCSTAAGPAFEGAHIRHGIGGVPGAINKVNFGEEGIKFTTIGGKPAKGICGSGVVDIAAGLARTGIMDSTGKIGAQIGRRVAFSSLLKRVQEVDGQPALLIVSQEEGGATDIFFTQKDVRQVQMAKAAIAAGIEILLAEMKIKISDVSRFYLAGGFGNYISYHSAQMIGLLPKEFKGEIIPIGNGAGVGAKMALLSRDYLYKADELGEKAEYIELSTNPNFQDRFMELMNF